MYWYFDYVEPVFRPPSEAHSLILQATVGCSQNGCTFCGMYKMKQFHCRPLTDLVAEMQRIPLHHRSRIQRVFLADGDALVYPQDGLLQILDALAEHFPALARVACYASPNSLTTKTVDELGQLRARKLRIFYFGLESGDDSTLVLANKKFTSAQMLELCAKVRQAGIKLSVTAILGLAGVARSSEHAAATADWVNAVSPEYFSLLTMFRRHNNAYFEHIEQLSNGQVLEETLAIVRQLHPERTILRSNHVSNILNLAGSYPKDRQQLIDQTEAALARARRQPDWYNLVPDYEETHF